MLLSSSSSPPPPQSSSLFNLRTRLAKLQLITLALTAASELLLFLATLTPAWQVAEDTDVGRSIQSGLWIYCPGQGQCWYIFSDDLINYYERVDVCRFLLIGDCRKKLLRTPYFFGWHYAVLILMLIVLTFGVASMIVIAWGMVRPGQMRISTVLLDVLLAFAFLLFGIGLAVFLINAEMLESRYLIGIKNTFQKQYGYSFFMACFAMTVMLFALMSAIFMTSSVFFMRDADAGSPVPMDEEEEAAAFRQQQQQIEDYNRGSRMIMSPDSNAGAKLVPSLAAFTKNQQQQLLTAAPSPMSANFVDWGTPKMGGVGGRGQEEQIPRRYCYAPSDVTSIP